MKALIINRDLSVTVHEGERDSWMDGDLHWDQADLDADHAIYFDDNAMEDANAIFARVGRLPNIPLPAVVVGVDGEDTGEPRMTASELKSIVSRQS